MGEDRGEQRAHFLGVDPLAWPLEVDAEPEVVLDLDEQVGEPDRATAGVQPAVQFDEAVRLRRVGVLGRVRLQPPPGVVEHDLPVVRDTIEEPVERIRQTCFQSWHRGSDGGGRRRGRRPARFCQEQTPVLAEQFSSMEHDAFRVHPHRRRLSRRRSLAHRHAVQCTALDRGRRVRACSNPDFCHRLLRRDQDRPRQAQDATPLACITTRMLSVPLMTLRFIVGRIGRGATAAGAVRGGGLPGAARRRGQTHGRCRWRLTRTRAMLVNAARCSGGAARRRRSTATRR